MEKGTVLFLAALTLYNVKALDNTKLLGAGIASGKEHELKIYQSSVNGYIAVKLIPFLPSTKSECYSEQLKNYNATINRLMGPINDNIKLVLSGVQTRTREGKLIGAIIGTAALGLATAAQVTAAIALEQAQDNARAILTLKESIRNTNNAVSELKTGLSEVSIALSKTQDYINTQIMPALSNLSCEIVGLKIGIQLSQYLTEVTAVFGNQITNPALQPLSMQALYQLCGGDFSLLLDKIGADRNELESLYEANLVTGRIVQYDTADQLVIIQVSIPSVSTLSGYRVTELQSISVDMDHGEGKAVIPRYIVTSGRVIEEMDISPCVLTATAVYCNRLLTTSLPDSVLKCLDGDHSFCTYTSNSGVLETRYIAFDGMLIANCRSIVCKCLDPPYIIPQNKGKPLTIISKEVCKKVTLDGITLLIDAEFTGEYGLNITIGPDQFAPSGALDISTELGKLNNSINKAEDYIDKSNELLNKVNVDIVNDTAVIVLCVMSALVVVWCIGLTVGLIYVSKNTLRAVAIKGTSIENPYVSSGKHAKNSS